MKLLKRTIYKECVKRKDYSQNHTQQTFEDTYRVMIPGRRSQGTPTKDLETRNPPLPMAVRSYSTSYTHQSCSKSVDKS